MASPTKMKKCLICDKNNKLTVPLQEVLTGFEFSVAEILQNLNFLTISDPENRHKNLCFICVAKVQYCYDFKIRCNEKENALNALRDNPILCELPTTPTPSSKLKQKKISKKNPKNASRENKSESIDCEEVVEVQEDRPSKVAKDTLESNTEVLTVVPLPTSTSANNANKRKQKNPRKKNLKTDAENQNGNDCKIIAVSEVQGNGIADVVLNMEVLTIVPKPAVTSVTEHKSISSPNNTTKMTCTENQIENDCKIVNVIEIPENQSDISDTDDFSSDVEIISEAPMSTLNNCQSKSSPKTNVENTSPDNHFDYDSKVVNVSESEGSQSDDLMASLEAFRRGNLTTIFPEVKVMLQDISRVKSDYLRSTSADTKRINFDFEKSDVNKIHEDKIKNGDDLFSNPEIVTQNSTLTSHIDIKVQNQKESFDNRHRPNRKFYYTHKSYTCDICNKEFCELRNLNTHKMIHTGEKPFGCDVCKKAFNQLSILNRHKLIHTGEKPHVCKICNKAFTERGSLARHKIIHTDLKPFVCPVCDKSFNQLRNLYTHKLIHTGERPYVCDVCNKSFNQHSILSRHKVIHQPQVGSITKKSLRDHRNLTKDRSYRANKKNRM